MRIIFILLLILIYYLLGINFTSLGQKRALDQRKALDLQLLLGLCDRNYPWVLLLILGLGLADNLASLLDHLEILLLEAACGLGGVAVVNLSAGANGNHFTYYQDFLYGSLLVILPYKFTSRLTLTFAYRRYIQPVFSTTYTNTCFLGRVPHFN